MEIFLLNEQDELCQGQEIGEICVRGTGVAHGYYANNTITQKVFIQNPLNAAWPDLIYRTGDLANYNCHGELNYIGRKDSQIKKNGYRIELGEIEQAAGGINGVERACALYDDEKKKILLFCIAKQIDEKKIYMELKQKIPYYMLPSEIVKMEEIVLNANGKIDRNQLKAYYRGKK